MSDGDDGDDGDGDDRLLAELREAVREGEAVPASFVNAAESAFAWRTLDAELARLLDEPAAAGVRSGDGPRTAGFRAGELGIELELDTEVVRGQLVPPQPGTVRLRTAERAGPPVPADELGWFVVESVREPFRVHVRTTDGRSVLTDWITP